MKDNVKIMVGECVGKALANPVARTSHYSPWRCAAVDMIVVIPVEGRWAQIDVNEAQDLRKNEQD